MENPQFTVRSMIMRSLDEVEFLETNEIPLLTVVAKLRPLGVYLLFTNKQALVMFMAVAFSAAFLNIYHHLFLLRCFILRITSDKVYPTEKKSAMPTNNNQLQQYNIILSPVSALSNMLSVLVVMIIIHVDLGAS
ncbi:hypothetical protein T03_2941 [Trichinella britovi]|uniref:Uncharacterized protein n=1 Tax=Trichinella britovi TaxID=45882 RepID=A0A0V1D045_TRIBR|nr:hypothetical protein T03_2941 [Trichinella britovi]